jgi:serine phosphatase RsbU (regulator of sigma subunit)
MALVLGNTISIRNNAGATITTNRYLLAVTNTERLVVDAETGLRGYVLTGRTLFLQPMTAAIERFPTTAATLQQAASQDGAFIGQAQALIADVRAYITSYVPTVLSEAKHGSAAAHSLPTTLEGKRLVDGIRARTGALEGAVSRRQTGRQRTSQDSADTAVAEAIAVLVALTLLTVLLGAFLGRLALARDRARARSERTAEILQRSLLPQALPAVPDCELAVRFRPAGAGELVGGDFYDVFALGSGRWAIVLGDVCGKGAEAAAITAMARWTLRSYIPATEDPAEPLRFLNDSMLRQDLDGRFITVVYLLLSVSAERAHVTVACAGHPPPIHAPALGEPAAVRARGQLLGVWPEIELATERLELMPGDGLVAYTDGVTDQGPGFSAEAPSVMLAERGSRPSAERLASVLEHYADRLRGPQQDDVAIVAVRFRGDGAHRGLAPAEAERGDQVVLRE